MNVFRRRWSLGLIGWALVTVVLVIVPLVFDSRSDRGWQNQLLSLLIWVGLSQAWNLIGGLAGQLSLGTSLFVGVGAYATEMMIAMVGLPWPVALLAAMLVPAALAWLLSFPLLRLSGVHLAIGSAALTLAAIAWMVTWQWAGESRGIDIPIRSVPQHAELFQTTAVSVCLTWIVLYVALNSRWGLRLMAVREHERAAAALGVIPARLKRDAWVLSSTLIGLIGLIGGCIALRQVTVEPNAMFNLNWSVLVVVMCVVGGLGTLWGPLLGGVVIYALNYWLFDNQPAWSGLAGGVLILLVISVAPGGLVGVLRLIWQKAVSIQHSDSLLRMTENRKRSAR